MFRLHKYYLLQNYYYLAPLISAMNKGFLKSIYLICSQRNLIRKPIHIPVFLLLQSNLLHHLSDFVLNVTILWMVWRSRDDRKIARTNTVCLPRHHVVYVPAVMRRQIIPNQNSMKVSAGDIVRLNIPADVVPGGRSTLPRTCGGSRGSPSSIAKIAVIFAPWW